MPSPASLWTHAGVGAAGASPEYNTMAGPVGRRRGGAGRAAAQGHPPLRRRGRRPVRCGGPAVAQVEAAVGTALVKAALHAPGASSLPLLLACTSRSASASGALWRWAGPLCVVSLDTLSLSLSLLGHHRAVYA